MNKKHIDQYIELRKALTEDEWNELDGCYSLLLSNKKSRAAEGISLNDDEIEAFRVRLLNENGISE